MLNLSALNILDVETMGERARRRREELKLTQEQVVSSVPGMTASALSQLENGNTKGVKPENLLDLAARLGLSVEELVRGEPRVALGKSKSFVPMRDVPIVGHAMANPIEDGFFDDMDFPPGAGEGYVPWATRDPNAYAVRVKGDSMQPRFRAGEIVVVEPGAAVVPGDDVVVRAKNGRKMVKRLLFQRGRELTLGSVNDRHPPLTISLDDIDSMHHIAGSVQRGTSTREG